MPLYDIEGTEAIEIIRKEGLSIPVRAFYSKKRTALESLALKKRYISSGCIFKCIMKFEQNHRVYFAVMFIGCGKQRKS